MTVRQLIEALTALGPDHGNETVVVCEEGVTAGRVVTAVYLTEPENPTWAIEVVVETSDPTNTYEDPVWSED